MKTKRKPDPKPADTKPDPRPVTITVEEGFGTAK
jgi:hypothetical protein